MTTYLSLNCDHCGKPSLIISQSGVIYCSSCSYSYGESAPDVIHIGGV